MHVEMFSLDVYKAQTPLAMQAMNVDRLLV